MNLYNCDFCHYNTQFKFNLDKHNLTRKHLDNIKTDKISHKKYECTKCHYLTDNKFDFEKHNLSIKHLSDKKSHKKYECEKCNFSTKCKTDYSKHLDTQKHINNNKEVNDDHVAPITELLIEIIKNQSVLQNKMLELTNNTTNNTTNNITNTNSNNNQFNLQFFLNETCKDAMNINEFINSLNVTIEDFVNTGNVGYVEGITQIILNGLKGVDTTKRPIHCTDVKRETVYIKSEDSWEKENQEKEKLKRVVKQVARMNLSQLPRWQRENPASEVLDTREHCQYMKYSLAALGGLGEKAEEQNIDKIMRNVIKETTIDKKEK